MARSFRSSSKVVPVDVSPQESCVVSNMELQRMHSLMGVVNPHLSSLSREKATPRKVFVLPTTSTNCDGVFNVFTSEHEVSNFMRKNHDSTNNPSTNKKLDVNDGTTSGRNFMDVVDVDTSQALQSYLSEELCGKLVESSVFRLVILVAILVNTVLVGVSTSDTMLAKYGAYLTAIDKICLTLFALEIMLKWYRNFVMFWKVGWNVFDFLIVFVSVVGDGMGFLRTGRVLRIFRVLRAFRSLRSISAVKGLQMVVQTIIRSLPDMGNILGLLLIVMFIFAVIGGDMFGEVVPRYFGTISDSLFTLFIAMTQDGWHNIYIDMKAAGLATTAAIYFAVFIVIGAFVFANIIVAVVVTNLQTAFKEMKVTRSVEHRSLNRTVNDSVIGRNNTLLSAPLNISKVDKSVWSSQEPREMPSSNQLSVEKLENYFLVLMSIEENLSERQKHTKELNRVLDIVNENNAHVNNELSDMEDTNRGTTGEKGDVLSAMLNTQKRRNELKEKTAQIQTTKQRAKMVARVTDEAQRMPAAKLDQILSSQMNVGGTETEIGIGPKRVRRVPTIEELRQREQSINRLRWERVRHQAATAPSLHTIVTSSSDEEEEEDDDDDF